MYHLNFVYPDGARVNDLCDQLTTLEAAKREAVLIARQLAGDLLLSGKAIVPGSIEICEASGRVVLLIPIEEAIRSGAGGSNDSVIPWRRSKR